MTENQQTISSILFRQSLWWCLSKTSARSYFEISSALAKRLEVDVQSLDSFLACLIEDYVPLLTAKLEEVFAQKSGSRALVGIQLPDQHIWLKMDLQYAEHDGMKIICAQCVDVSEMRKLEQKLVVSQSQLMLQQHQDKENQAVNEAKLLQEQYDAQTQFLAMLSHELRSPLLGMGSLVGLIKKNYANSKPIDDQIKTIKLTIDQMNFLINDILTYAQTQFNSIEIHETQFELDQMADYVSHLTKSIAQEKGVFVSVVVTVENYCFLGDVVRISQILVNLIVNAIKFTQFGGVFVEIKESQQQFVLNVMDSGVGIDADEIENIFKPFKQIDSINGRQYIGSGLGLSIVKTLVELMKGEVSIQSTKGIGTSFIVKLPLKRCNQQEDPLEKRAQPYQSHERFKDKNVQIPCQVLVADDSIINRKVLEAFLEELGVDVVHAADGKQALKLFKENTFHFVFLDIQMPIYDGVKVCRKIRSLPSQKLQNLKAVFALTAAHTEGEIAKMGIEVDKAIFDEWVEKPISQDKVMSLLNAYKCDASLSSQNAVSKDAIPSHLQHLLPQFIETTQNDFVQLFRLLEEGQMLNFKKNLHSLKGGLMMFGLNKMVEQVKALELLDIENKSEEARNLLSNMNEIFNNLY